MRSLFGVTCREFLLACTMNRELLLQCSLWLRLRAVLGMVTAQRWSICRVRGHGSISTTASAPVVAPAVASAAAPGAPAWLEIGRFFGEVGVLSVWPPKSYCAQLNGANSSGTRGGAGAFFCSAPAAPSAQGQQPGSSWCWKGGIFRGWRIFAVHVWSTAPPEQQSRVLRIRVGWSGSTTDCTGGREVHHYFGVGGGAGGSVSSSAGRDACRCTGGKFN